MATRETLTKKADALLKHGDALSRTDRAESKRLLRKCRHYRRLAKAAKK
jgi:hypothetical protein